LDAATKYPWQLHQAREYGNQVKFGVYGDDLEVFDWMRQEAPDGAKCVEAQIMDFADDVAYSVHDFEDAIVEGFIDPAVISDPASAEALIEEVGKWSGGMLAKVQLEEAFDLLQQSSYWLTQFDGSPRSLAQLKNEIAVLKGIVASQVMTSDDRQGYYEDQRNLLMELADVLYESGSEHLDSVSLEAWNKAESDQGRKRVIVDQVASLTDPIAVAMHQRLRS